MILVYGLIVYLRQICCFMALVYGLIVYLFQICCFMILVYGRAGIKAQVL